MIRRGAHTAPSNERFDASLRAQDERWGIRDMEAVAALTAEAGFALAEIVAMPANNFSLVFRLTLPEVAQHHARVRDASRQRS